MAVVLIITPAEKALTIRITIRRRTIVGQFIAHTLLNLNNVQSLS
jgi:hypothetical protein